MKKTLFLLTLFVSLAASSALAQTTLVQITGGKLAVFAGGESYLETTSFRAASNNTFVDYVESRWHPICFPSYFECSGGSTFRLPSFTDIGEDVGHRPFRTGEFTVNNTTYPAFYFGAFVFANSDSSESLSVSIPKFANLRRKGTFRISRPFELLPSRFKVCKVSTMNRACPADQVLFDGSVQGRGTLTITFQYRFYQHLNPQLQLFRKSFVYEFEP